MARHLRSVALLQEARFRDVVLLEDADTGTRLAGHRLKLPSAVDAARLQDVAARLGTLAHPRVAGFRGKDETDGDRWFLFDHVDGHPLWRYAPLRLPTPLIGLWLLELLDVLRHLHEHDMLAGGLTPEALVVADGHVHLVDTGYLHVLLPEAMALDCSPTRRTLLAPEERHSALHGVAGDLYSAGAMAHWLVTGYGPGHPDAFARQRVTPLQERQVEGRTQNLLACRPDLPPVVAESIATLIQFQPADRGSASVLIERMSTTVLGVQVPCPPPEDVDLDPLPPPQGNTPRAQASASTTPSPARVPRTQKVRRRRRSLASLGALVALGLLGTTWGVWHTTSHAAPPPPAMLRVETGTALFGERGQWNRVSDIPSAGIIVADEKGVTLLSAGASRISLQPSSSVQVAESRALEVLQGQMEVRSGPSETNTLLLRGGSLELAAGSDVHLTLEKSRTVVQVDTGNATLVRPADAPVALGAGQWLELQGSHGDWVVH